MSRPVGGYGEEIDLHSEIQGICEKVKPNVEKKADQKFHTFIPLSFIQQIVAGTNYIIKVYVGHAGADECIHVKVFQALSGNGGKLAVHGHQYPKTKADIITTF
ncbi:putative cystatin-B-like [Triplophysa rosa]|uniref:Cystatin-B n=1 Tax=Triplophysa rosa TaxID=992332 RepID=A0A9W8CB92_TRIRA|nr:putative cystatin-B-like [Triplophysa rosa]